MTTPRHCSLCPEIVAFAARRRPLHDLTSFAAVDHATLLRLLITNGHPDIALQYGATREQVRAAHGPRQLLIDLPGDPTP